MFLSKGLLKLFVKDKRLVTEEMFNRNDLQYFIKEAAVLQMKNEVNVDPKLLENVLDLKDIRVRECMVPRTRICSVEVNIPINELIKTFIEKGFSRIIVYKENIDQILGYVHHFEMLNKPENIRSLLIPVMLIPESMNASDLLDQFIREHKNIAWVVDEFGGTSGIVTLEDVIEEIFGEIQDEHDEGDLLEKQISVTEFLFSARLEIDYLNEKYDFNLPEGDYETLSGLILDHAEHIPGQGAKLKLPGFIFTILEGKKNRLDKIKLNLMALGDEGPLDL
jgi:CBS domain containing-hemolysin-like protein